MKASKKTMRYRRFSGKYRKIITGEWRYFTGLSILGISKKINRTSAAIKDHFKNYRNEFFFNGIPKDSVLNITFTGKPPLDDRKEVEPVNLIMTED